MKNYPLAGFRPLFAILFLIALFTACRKDNFLSGDNPSSTNKPSSVANFPITVDEAMAYFNSLNLHSSATLTGDDTISFNFVSMEPSWEQAFVGQTQSGRETVIVPVPDSLLKFLNQGRSGAKLLFSKISPDTIFANLLVYLADSAYYQDNNHLLDFNTFTGLYVLLDIEQRFITGVRMHGGIPVGRVKSLSRQSSPNPEDRDDTFDEDCITYFESILAPCPPQAFTECYDVTIVETEDCDGPGSGGGGGSGTTTGGSGNGGGTSTGGGTGGTTNPPTTPTYWDVFSGQIPIELFTGALPPGFDLQLFQQLVDIVKAHHFSVEQVKWLMDHTGFIPVIWSASGPNQVGEESSMVEPVLNLAMKLNLNDQQYQFLIYHQNVFEPLANFLILHPNSPEARNFVLQALDAQMFLSQVPNQPLFSLNDLIRIYENFGTIEEALLPPTNTPVSVGDPICLATMNFSILHNSFANQDYAAMVLKDIYIQFTIPNASPLMIHLDNLRMESFAENNNNTCLASSGVHGVNAINSTVAQIQQMIESPPPNTTRARILNAIYFIFEQRMDNNFRQQVQWCNPSYTSSASLRQDNFDQANEVNCDDAMANCP